MLPRSTQLPTCTLRHSIQQRGAQNTCRTACCSHTSQSEQCTQISSPSLASRAGVLSLHCAQEQRASSLSQLPQASRLSQQYHKRPLHKEHSRRLWSSSSLVRLTGSRVLRLPVEEACCWSTQPLRTKGASCRQPCAREQGISLLPLSFEGKNKNA